MKKLMYLIILLFITSCTINRDIVYKTDNLSRYKKSIPILVEIKKFKDLRKKDPKNAILFEQPKKAIFENENKWTCINSEKHYEKEKVTKQFTKQLVKHFNKLEVFKFCNYNQEENANYYLTGNLTRFYIEQEFSNAAATGEYFGLVGALATSGIETPANIIIEVTNIKLFKRDGELEKKLGDFRKEYNEELKADGSCWCVYSNINNKLKDFNTSLAEKIRSDLLNYKFDQK